MKKYILWVVILSGMVSHHAWGLEATLGWSNRTELSSAVSGIITRVEVKAGQQVKKDSILTQLSQAFYSAQFNKAKAVRTSEKLQLEEARRELDRSLELYDRAVLAEHELQMAKNSHKKALANYKKAQQGYIKARNDLGFSTIKAPFDAIVIKVLHKQSEIINASIEAPLMVVVAESGKMIATTGVSAAMLDEVKTGSPASVAVNGKTYSGKVVAIGLEFTEGTSLYPLKVEFETGNTLLRAGMKADIQF